MEKLTVPAVVVIALDCDKCDVLTIACVVFCTIVVDCGIDTVRKTAPTEFVVIVAVALPFKRVAAAVD